MKNFFFFLALLTTCQLFAQDTHYWTQQFGSHSTLMSGALVAGEEDISMLFYNPGAIGDIVSGSITISASMYRLENITVTNALGQQADFKSSQFASLPLMAGGIIRSKGKLKMAYGLMVPTDFGFKGLARVDDSYPIVDDAESPGSEALIATASKNAKLNETMVGFGAGYPINENFSVGATMLFTLRTQDYFETFLTRMYLNDAESTFVNTSFLENLNYWNVRGVLKFGATYKKDNWSYGLTLTMPSVNLMGKGTVAIDIAANNYKVVDQRVNILASDRQPKLATTYKSPLSIAGGVKYKSGKSTYALSAQYFGGIDHYEIVKAAPSAFVRPPDVFEGLGSENFLKVPAGAKPVFNIAVGYENQISENQTLNFGFRNDMSYYDSSIANTNGINPVISSWDLYHFVGGTTFTKNRHTLSTGLLFSWGKKNDYEQVNTIGGDLAENDLLQGSTSIAGAKYSSVGILLGYTLNFN